MVHQELGKLERFDQGVLKFLKEIYFKAGDGRFFQKWKEL